MRGRWRGWGGRLRGRERRGFKVDMDTYEGICS